MRKMSFSLLQHRFRIVLSRPRLFSAILVGVVAYFLIPHQVAIHTITKVILAWNCGAWLYLLMAFKMMLSTDQSVIAERARAQDEDKFVILGMVILSAVVAIGAIVAELGVVKHFQGLPRIAHIGLTIVTILSSWAFTQMMFAIHYAHDYYLACERNEAPGLCFPGETKPDYFDFLYFSCVIGTSGQTADVSLTSHSMRRIGLIHCILAFFFNTTLIALSINIASGLI